jgi:hypothetical protein
MAVQFLSFLDGIPVAPSSFRSSTPTKIKLSNPRQTSQGMSQATRTQLAITAKLYVMLLMPFPGMSMRRARLRHDDADSTSRCRLQYRDSASRSDRPELWAMTRPPTNPCCADPALDNVALWLAGLTPDLLSDLMVHECCGSPIAVLISPCDLRCNRETALYSLACFVTICQEKVCTYTACACRPACLRQTRTIRIAATRSIVSSGHSGRDFLLRRKDLQARLRTTHRLSLLAAMYLSEKITGSLFPTIGLYCNRGHFIVARARLPLHQRHSCSDAALHLAIENIAPGQPGRRPNSTAAA